MRQILLLLFTFFTIGVLVADTCPYDHLKIGRNPDGIDETDDDMKLFLEVTQKYRHSDPNDTGTETWLHWDYPMTVSPVYNRRQVSEPGFDLIADGSNQQLLGLRNQDYRLIVECVRISPGLYARNLPSGPYINLTQPGHNFCHSCASDSHVHVQYRLPLSADPNQPYWITYRVYDEFEMYQPSDEVTVVFLNPPIQGDLVVDNQVDSQDIAAFVEHWLAFSNAAQYNIHGQAAYDLFERADINRDYVVDIADFALLARHWLMVAPDDD